MKNEDIPAQFPHRNSYMGMVDLWARHFQLLMGVAVIGGVGLGGQLPTHIVEIRGYLAAHFIFDPAHKCRVGAVLRPLPEHQYAAQNVFLYYGQDHPVGARSVSVLGKRCN